MRGHGFGNRRDLSLISVHSTFPATLYRFQLQRESKLYDTNLGQDDGEVEMPLKSPKMDWFVPELPTQVRKCPFPIFTRYSDLT